MKRRHKRHRKTGKRKKIDLDMDQLDDLLKRAESGTLQEKDVELIKGMAECISVLSQAVDEKASSVKKLLRMVFGAATEKKENVPGASGEKKDGQQDSDSAIKGRRKKKGNNGKNGADAYVGAQRVQVNHPDLTPGSGCTHCKEGKLYKNSKFGVEIRVRGAAPLQATVYELQKLRCNLCGKIFTAPMPKEAGNKKYDAAAVAMIALLKYGSGLPFNRIGGLQANLGTPLPSSTQWDIINRSVKYCKPAYEKMVELAAQGQIFHNDDTTIKIQTLIKENKNDSPDRTGMFTTGIVSVHDNRKIVLFLSGRKHAGENLEKLLSLRDTSLQTPLQMCDALSRNTPAEFNTILAYCLVHARRHFVDAVYYMLNHWQQLTAFLKIPNAPLDNNIAERALKKAILHRKIHFSSNLNTVRLSVVCL